MGFDFQKVKTQSRRVVHDTLAVRAFYKDSTMSSPVEIRARHHDKIAQYGDLDNQGYAVTVEGVDRIVFSAEDARVIGVSRGGEIWFPDAGEGLGAHLGGPLGGSGGGPVKFILQQRVPGVGPYEEVWEVTRK